MCTKIWARLRAWWHRRPQASAGLIVVDVAGACGFQPWEYTSIQERPLGPAPAQRTTQRVTASKSELPRYDLADGWYQHLSPPTQRNNGYAPAQITA
jgi:hypothetical protein